jgi:hypothetical protein
LLGGSSVANGSRAGGQTIVLLMKSVVMFAHPTWLFGYLFEFKENFFERKLNKPD